MFAKLRAVLTDGEVDRKGAFGMDFTVNVPADAQLTSVSTTEDADGTTTYTVVYKAKRATTTTTTNATASFGLGSTPVDAAPPAARRTFPLRCEVKTYAWGRMSEESLVARLKEAGDDDFAIAKDTPYGELWMGTHPSGPSIVRPPAPPRPRPLTHAHTHPPSAHTRTHTHTRAHTHAHTHTHTRTRALRRSLLSLVLC